MNGATLFFIFLLIWIAILIATLAFFHGARGGKRDLIADPRELGPDDAP